LTFAQLQDDALEALNLPSDVSSTARTRIKRKINEGYRLLLADVGMGRYRDSTTTIVTVVGTAEYTVTASKIHYVRDVTNNTRLTETSLGDLRTLDPGDTSTGNPLYYAIRKYVTPTTMTVRLWPIPSEIVTLQVDITAAITDLSADADLPVFAAEFHPILSIYARMCEYEKMDDTRLDHTRREYIDWLKQLRYFVRKSGTRATMQGPGLRGYVSQLGPDFPERQ
jgi:hypothetical protein